MIYWLPKLVLVLQVIGQFNLGFIIGKLDSDLFIVDQVNFSQLLDSFSGCLHAFHEFKMDRLTRYHLVIICISNGM